MCPIISRPQPAPFRAVVASPLPAPVCRLFRRKYPHFFAFFHQPAQRVRSSFSPASSRACGIATSLSFRVNIHDASTCIHDFHAKNIFSAHPISFFHIWLLLIPICVHACEFVVALSLSPA